MNKNEYNSIFDNLTDIKFEEMLKDSGFEFTKVDGKGGLYVNGEQISSHSLKEEYDTLKMFVENNNRDNYLKISTLNINSTGEIFDILEDYELVA